jgi:hypothetical protein
LTTLATVLLTLLLLEASPDAHSTGTIVGLMHAAGALSWALGTGVSGASFVIGREEGLSRTNAALWIVVIGFAGVGAGLSGFVRERPGVGGDWPVECLRWEECWDAGKESCVDEGKRASEEWNEGIV